MSNIPVGQMTWKPPGSSEPALHLRHNESEEWRSYKEFPRYFLPDPAGFSEGYATFIALRKENWQLI